MEQEQEKDERFMKDSAILSRTFRYIKPEMGKFIAAISLMVFVVLGEVITPYLMGSMIDKIKEGFGTTYFLKDLVIDSLAYILLATISLILMYNEAMILQKAGQNIVYRLREDVFAHIEKLSIAQINAIPVGKFVTRVTNDTNAVNDLYTNILVNMLKNCIALVGFGIMMFLLDWKIALMMMCFLPIVAIISYLFRRFSRKAYREMRNNLSFINAFLSENLSGMKITQIFNQEQRKEEEFTKANNALKISQRKQINVFALFRPTIFVLYICAEILVVLFGVMWLGSEATRIEISFIPPALHIENTPLTIGIVFSLYSYVGRFFQPIQTIAEQFNGLQRCFAASERLFMLLDTKPDLEDEQDAIELDVVYDKKGNIVYDKDGKPKHRQVLGQIEFKDVWFCYKQDEWILKGVSFKVEPKQTVAFVGATGAGKTTILSLITRNYEIQKGQILIDGIDIRKITLTSLRRSIGQMLQDVFLFSGTIESNISLRDDSIPLSDIEEAARYVGADAFINKLDGTYQYKLQERGSNFSAGQRQLISFARTIVHKPQIMILDEATANIDTETEVLIQQSLEKMMNIGTMLIVAHRLSTIQHADNIIVLQKGEILEQGTHQNLLKKKGYYYNLYKLQFENKD